MRIQEETAELQKKVNERICVSDITFLSARHYGTFCRFFYLLPSFRLLRTYVVVVVKFIFCR